MRIEFAGEAYELFQQTCDKAKGWGVKVTPQEGEPFDARLLGSAVVEPGGWCDAVTVLRVDDDFFDLPDAKPETLRIEAIYVY